MNPVKVDPFMVACGPRSIELRQLSGATSSLGINSINGHDIESVEINETQAQIIACWLAKRYGFGIDTSAREVRQIEYTAVAAEVPVVLPVERFRS